MKGKATERSKSSLIQQKKKTLLWRDLLLGDKIDCFKRRQQSDKGWTLSLNTVYNFYSGFLSQNTFNFERYIESCIDVRQIPEKLIYTCIETAMQVNPSALMLVLNIVTHLCIHITLAGGLWRTIQRLAVGGILVWPGKHPCWLLIFFDNRVLTILGSGLFG